MPGANTCWQTGLQSDILDTYLQSMPVPSVGTLVSARLHSKESPARYTLFGRYQSTWIGYHGRVSHLILLRTTSREFWTGGRSTYFSLFGI